MKVKIIVLLVGIALIVGILSGCQEEEPSPPANVEPTADFTATVNNTTVTFEDGSSDTDGNITAWSWDFGDGNTSTLQNPEHTYEKDDKVYTVTLTVTDDDDATATKTKEVTVGTPNVAPVADFSFEATNLSVNFTDNSTDSDGTIASWSWDFGDGNTSNVTDPTYEYAAADTYTVTLTVIDDDGATHSVMKDVTVTEEETE